MSSLLKEELQRLIFTPEGQQLKEFIEIIETAKARHFLCVSVNKVKAVQISVVKNLRANRLDTFERTEEWFLKDMVLLDGKDSDADEPQFVMHFDTARSMAAVSCAAKYSLARSLVSLSTSHCQKDLPLINFDFTYIRPTSLYSSRGPQPLFGKDPVCNVENMALMSDKGVNVSRMECSTEFRFLHVGHG